MGLVKWIRKTSEHWKMQLCSSKSMIPSTWKRREHSHFNFIGYFYLTTRCCTLQIIGCLLSWCSRQYFWFVLWRSLIDHINYPDLFAVLLISIKHMFKQYHLKWATTISFPTHYAQSSSTLNCCYINLHQQLPLNFSGKNYKKRHGQTKTLCNSQKVFYF